MMRPIKRKNSCLCFFDVSSKGASENIWVDPPPGGCCARLATDKSITIAENALDMGGAFDAATAGAKILKKYQK